MFLAYFRDTFSVETLVCHFYNSIAGGGCFHEHFQVGTGTSRPGNNYKPTGKLIIYRKPTDDQNWPKNIQKVLVPKPTGKLLPSFRHSFHLWAPLLCGFVCLFVCLWQKTFILCIKDLYQVLLGVYLCQR